MKKYSFLFIILLMLLSGCNSGSDNSKGPSNAIDPDTGNPFDPDRPTNCLAIDNDGDGLIDCLDPDIDGDGFANEIDAFRFDPTEWKDTDGDRTGDNSDAFPLENEEWGDFDNDGIGDNADEDDDNDGVPDEFEYINFSMDLDDWKDLDKDLMGPSIDEDDDNDGVPNLWDDLWWNKNAGFDIDGDLVGNEQDSDIDGDSILNLTDAFPYDSSEWTDTDNDRLGNNIDPDDDNDGFPDSWEEFSENVQYFFDTDGDGFVNEVDAFPYDSNEWIDTDGDGFGDNADVFPFDELEWKDTDLDGLGDNRDPDIDGDGFRNCIPVDFTGPTSCNQDRFPTDRDEWLDNDLDSVGDNSDEDDDNDGIPDAFDEYRTNKLHFHDLDKDGLPDSTFPGSTSLPDASLPASQLPAGAIWFVFDEDVDGDGCPNSYDRLPYDSFDCFDLDGDRIGDNRDNDVDGDGYLNNLDLFPFDSTEWGDNDLDTLGDNVDEDDDNDGVPDVWDALSFASTGFSDYNNDGLPDQTSLDIDADGFTNGLFSCQIETSSKVLNIVGNNIFYFRKILKSNPSSFEIISLNTSVCPFSGETYFCNSESVTVCGYPPIDINNPAQRRDLYIWDNTEWGDSDRDKLPDNSDEDDDNDGVPDNWDSSATDNVALKSFSWNDLDGDGTPDSTLYFEDSQWQFAFDSDIDGDGIPNGDDWSCNLNTDNPPKRICSFVKSYNTVVTNPLFGYGNNPNTVEILFELDYFPYSSIDSKDTDRDGVGDNRDSDIDADGRFNCVPVDLNSVQPCNQDALPTVGQSNVFVTETFDVFDSNGPDASIIQEVNYCANASDCFFKNYDRDSDGLTDYEEFLNYSNPLVADTDGDGIPDNVEFEEGTAPYDPNDFLDSDGDGVANFLDKTPNGAFDEASLRNQFVNASSCQNKLLQEVCVDDSTGLCHWDSATSLCKSKEILITKDINVNDCLEITGEVKVRGSNKWNVNFSSAIETGARCSGTDITAITGSNESSISFENLIFTSSNIDKFIQTTGKLLSLKETAVMIQNEITPKVIDMNNLTTGVISLNKVNIHTRKNLATSDEEDIPIIDNISLIESISNTLNFTSVVVSCNVGNAINTTSNFNCINTTANTATFNYLTSVIDFSVSFTSQELNTYSFKHQSNVSTSFIGRNSFASPVYAGRVNGTGLAYTASNIFTNDKDTVTIVDNEITGVTTSTITPKLNVNGTKIAVSELEKVETEQIFDIFPSPRLYCSANDPDEDTPSDTRTININYFLSSPIESVLNSRVVNIFNNAATNLTPEGVFETSANFNVWNFGMDTGDGERFPVSIWDNTLGENKALLLSGPTSFSGIGRYFTSTNIDITKKHEIQFLIKPENELENLIELDVLIFNSSTLAPIKIAKIKTRPNPATPNQIIDSQTGLIELFYDFTSGYEMVRIEFRTTTPNIGIQMVNNTAEISRNLFIDNVKLLKAKEYSIQYPGITMPFCE
jgi:hypothetical protein